MSFKVSKDTFTPFIKDLTKKASQPKLKGFLTSQRNEMERNETEMFRRQVYFTGFYEADWEPLAVATVKNRTKKGTWHGSADSILKEYRLLMYKLLNFGLRTNGNSLIARLFVGTGSHSYSRESYKSIAKKHQEGFGVNLPKRPVYSWLLSSQKTIFNNFIKHIWQ
jgi:hypothetical protein